MSFAELVDATNGVVWSIPLVGLCLLAGLYFTVRTRAVQVSLPDMIAQLRDGEKSANGTSSFQSLMMSLANRVGMGNIGGVATAIAFGGAGAVFWMWTVALLGAATSFVECTLGQIYKEQDPDTGEYRGGPAYYFEKAYAH
jgi:AGCS family alanine or glycine:cation symporter